MQTNLEHIAERADHGVVLAVLAITVSAIFACAGIVLPDAIAAQASPATAFAKEARP